MTIRSDLTIDWAASPRVIEVAAPSVEIVGQDLLDTLRSEAATPKGMAYSEIVDAAGKDDLGGGAYVGLTIRLLNARVKFEDRGGPGYIACNIKACNLLAVDANGNPMSPIEPSAYTQVTRELSTAGVILQATAEWTQQEKDNLLNLVTTKAQFLA